MSNIGINTRQYYTILEVEPDASVEQIKSQYHFLLHAWHPDKFPKPEQKSRAQQKARELNEAYSVLSDSRKRARYDALNATRTSKSAGQANQSTGETVRGKYAQRAKSTAREEWEKLEREHQRSAKHGNKSQERARSSSDATTDALQCWKCSASNSTLRLAFFPYVISFLILTFRRGWEGLYCEKCRRQEMFKAKFITLALGWWGFPLGVIYTLGVLFSSDQGKVLPEINAPYLKKLGSHFLRNDQIGEALDTFNESLKLQKDTELETFIEQLRGGQRSALTKAGYSRGIGFTPIFSATVATILVWLYFTGTVESLTFNNAIPSIQPFAQVVQTEPADLIDKETNSLQAAEWVTARLEKADFSISHPSDWHIVADSTEYAEVSTFNERGLGIRWLANRSGSDIHHTIERNQRSNESKEQYEAETKEFLLNHVIQDGGELVEMSEAKIISLDERLGIYFDILIQVDTANPEPMRIVMLSFDCSQDYWCQTNYIRLGEEAIADEEWGVVKKIASSIKFN